MDRIKVFHLDVYQIMRDGVKRLLMDDAQFEVVGDAESGQQLFDLIRTIEVHVLILDIYLDGMEDLKQMNSKP